MLPEPLAALEPLPVAEPLPDFVVVPLLVLPFVELVPVPVPLDPVVLCPVDELPSELPVPVCPPDVLLLLLSEQPQSPRPIVPNRIAAVSRSLLLPFYLHFGRISPRCAPAWEGNGSARSLLRRNGLQ